jgi:phage baseplate assembly protein W
MVEIVTPRNRRKAEYFSDFRKDLFPNLVNSDISRKTDEEAVKESIRNLILTDTGERLFQPNIGCDVRRQLFENFTPQTKFSIETSIRTVINQYEPRCQLISVEATGDPDKNVFYVTIIFILINIPEEIELVLTLDRAR